MSASGCVAEGIPLHWSVGCVSHSVQRDATTWANLAEVTRVVDAAFNAWTAVVCPGTAEGPSLRLANIGPVTCRKSEYNNGVTMLGGNANIVVFYDDAWNTGDAGAEEEGTLALTTVTYDMLTGEIIDADIQVNGENVLSTATPVPSNAYDMQSLLTHEVGHFLGLSHSQILCSGAHDCPTMRALYPRGEDGFRTLEADDIAGVCAAYPPGRQSVPTCIPDFGFSTECGIPVEESSGCQVAGARRPPSSNLLAALLGVIAASWLRRKAAPCRDLA